jgi:hypothetical protein
MLTLTFICLPKECNRILTDYPQLKSFIRAEMVKIIEEHAEKFKIGLRDMMDMIHHPSGPYIIKDPSDFKDEVDRLKYEMSIFSCPSIISNIPQTDVVWNLNEIFANL